MECRSLSAKPANKHYREKEYSQTLREINELQNKRVDFDFMFSIIFMWLIRKQVWITKLDWYRLRRNRYGTNRYSPNS